MSMAAAIPLRSAVSAVTVPVAVYTAWWCLRGHRLRLALARTGVRHRAIDLGLHPDAAVDLARLPAGRSAPLPVVAVDGEWLSNPTADELERALIRHGLLEPRRVRRSGAV